jgi:hypothetical protein
LGHCSKTVVVLFSERGILDHDGSTGAVCKRLKNQVEQRIFITDQNPPVNSKSADLGVRLASRHPEPHCFGPTKRSSTCGATLCSLSIQPCYNPESFAIRNEFVEPTIWVQGSINSSGEFLATPKVAASAVECPSVTAKCDLDTVEVRSSSPPGLGGFAHPTHKILYVERQALPHHSYGHPFHRDLCGCPEHRLRSFTRGEYADMAIRIDSWPLCSFLL